VRHYPRLAVLDVAGAAEMSVRWLHQRAPGHRVTDGSVYQSGPLSPPSQRGRELDITRRGRRFVMEAQELRGQARGRDSAWIVEAVRLLDEVNHIDLSVGGVRDAIEAAVILSTAGLGGLPVKAHAYVADVGAALRRDIEQAASTLRQRRAGRSTSTEVRL